MKELFSNYAENYEEYKEFIHYLFTKRPPIDGQEAQREGICYFNQNDVTERERLIIILSVIKWEIDHDMLTEELAGELDYYYHEYQLGNLNQHIAPIDKTMIVHDLIECYKKIFE